MQFLVQLTCFLFFGTFIGFVPPLSLQIIKEVIFMKTQNGQRKIHSMWIISLKTERQSLGSTETWNWMENEAYLSYFSGNSLNHRIQIKQ